MAHKIIMGFFLGNPLSPGAAKHLLGFVLHSELDLYLWVLGILLPLEPVEVKLNSVWRKHLIKD